MGGGSPCHMLIIRNDNVTLSNLGNPHVAMSILRKCPVPCHYIFFNPLSHVAKGHKVPCCRGDFRGLHSKKNPCHF